MKERSNTRIHAYLFRFVECDPSLDERYNIQNMYLNILSILTSFLFLNKTRILLNVKILIICPIISKTSGLES